MLTDSGRIATGEPFALAPASAETLMESFLNGNALAFELLFRSLSPRVVQALTQMSGDARLAEDLTQLVFLKVYRARAAYQPSMLVMPWVFSIARNAFLDHLRHARRRPETLTTDGTLPEPVGEHSPEQGSEADQRFNAVHDLLRTLPADQREALLLLKVQGLSLAETAALCGTSPASIKMRAHRAYRSLRVALANRVRQ